LVPSSDGGDDFVGVCGPCEGLRVGVGLGEEAVDGGLEVDDGAEDAPRGLSAADLKLIVMEIPVRMRQTRTATETEESQSGSSVR
jgi:hypothetical protein